MTTTAGAQRLDSPPARAAPPLSSYTTSRDTTANCLLTIDLVRELPESMKPRTIQIGTGATSRKQIASKAA